MREGLPIIPKRTKGSSQEHYGVLKLLIEVKTYQFSIEGVAYLSPTTADCMQVPPRKENSPLAHFF